MLKQTHEIGRVIALLEPLDIAGKTLTADAWLPQRKLAQYLIERNPDYVFTVKDNQPILREGIRLIFEGRGKPNFTEPLTLAHGRIERSTLEKTTGKLSTETVYGLTRHTPGSADVAFNRGHWSVENACHHLLDWNWGEDRCTIRTGQGPENITALRRFAIGAIKSKSPDTVAATIQRLARNLRLVFDYLRMTENSRYRTRAPQVQAG